MSWFRIEAPISAFRPYEARDYQETLPLPPHSTVFGCVLSFLGVDAEGAAEFAGTELAVGGRTGDRSTVVRKMRRDPAAAAKGRVRVPQFRPEYQEIVTDVTLWVCLSRGEAARDLAAELRSALQLPENIVRHGIVSLGESSFMIDRIDPCTDGPTDTLVVLRPDPEGPLSLTVWVDFIDRTRTRSMRFRAITGRPEPTDAVAIHA